MYKELEQNIWSELEDMYKRIEKQFGKNDALYCLITKKYVKDWEDIILNSLPGHGTNKSSQSINTII